MSLTPITPNHHQDLILKAAELMDQAAELLRQAAQPAAAISASGSHAQAPRLRVVPSPTQQAPAPSPAMVAAAHRRRPKLIEVAADPWSRVEILDGARQWAQRNQITLEQITQALDDPSRTVSGFNDCTWKVRGEAAVLQAPDRTVLAVRRSDETLPGPCSSGRSTTISGGGGWTPPEEPAEMAELLREHGFRILVLGSGHYSAEHPDHPGQALTYPATPSDHRWAKNFISQVRRATGIQLRPSR